MNASRYLKNLKISGKIAGEAITLAKNLITKKVNFSKINDEITDYIVKNSAKPSFKNYNGYPAAVCISVNEKVVHGIPTDDYLKENDVATIDIGVNYRRAFTDTALTVYLGKDRKIISAIAAARESLRIGISKVKLGARVAEVSRAIEKTANEKNLGVVKNLCGHGTGKGVHLEPLIPNYNNESRYQFKKYDVVAIEPIFSFNPHGKKAATDIRTLSDGWTISLPKGNIGLNFEDTLLVLENEVINLTESVDS